MRAQRLNLSGTKDSGSGRKHVMAWRLPRFFFWIQAPPNALRLRNAMSA